MTKGTLFRGLAALGATWGLVILVVSWAGERRATPEKVTEAIASAGFEDWSGRDGATMSEETREARRRKLDEVAAIFVELDLRERKEVSGQDNLRFLFGRLSREEKIYLVDLVFSRHADQMMAVFDEMEPEAREHMMERTMREMTDGEGAKALAELKESDPDLVKLIIKKGFKAYFTEASVETKMALLPFLDEVGELVQGFGKPRTEGL